LTIVNGEVISKVKFTGEKWKSDRFTSNQS